MPGYSDAISPNLPGLDQAFVNAPSARPRLGAIGDSMTAQNKQDAVPGVVNASYLGRGPVTQAVSLLGGTVEYPLAGIMGYSGKTTGFIREQLPSIIQTMTGLGVEIVHVMAGANDITLQTPYSMVIANLQAIYESLFAANISVVATPILPRTYWPFDAQTTINMRRQLQRINRWIRYYGRNQKKGKMRVSNGDIAMTNFSSATADPILGTIDPADGQHPLGYGAYLVGVEIAAAIRDFLPYQTARGALNAADVFDATYNPLGALNPNPRMQGSAALTGTAGSGGTWAAGNWATGFAAPNRNTGSQLQVVGSKFANTDQNGGERQRVTIGAAGTAGLATESVRIPLASVTPGAASFAAGDWVEAEIELEWSGMANVYGIELALIDFDNATSLGGLGMAFSPNIITREPAAKPRHLIQVPAMQTRTAIASLIPRLVIYGKCDGVAPTGVIDIHRFSPRRTTAPA